MELLDADAEDGEKVMEHTMRFLKKNSDWVTDPAAGDGHDIHFYVFRGEEDVAGWLEVRGLIREEMHDSPVTLPLWSPGEWIVVYY